MKKCLTLILCLAVTTAYADTLNQSGNSNIAQQGDHNNIDSGNTTVGSVHNNNENNNHNSNSNHNSAESSSHASASANNHNSNHQGQEQYQGQSVDGSGNSSNSYVNKNPASTATSANLVAADDTCMGSSSAGAQGMGFGISAGSTWRDGDCVRRKDARELHNMGYKTAAIALLCQSGDVANAMETAGTPCAGKLAKLAPAAGGNSEYKKEATDYDFLGNKH